MVKIRAHWAKKCDLFLEKRSSRSPSLSWRASQTFEFVLHPFWGNSKPNALKGRFFFKLTAKKEIIFKEEKANLSGVLIIS